MDDSPEPPRRIEPADLEDEPLRPLPKYGTRLGRVKAVGAVGLLAALGALAWWLLHR